MLASAALRQCRGLMSSLSFASGAAVNAWAPRTHSGLSDRGAEISAANLAESKKSQVKEMEALQVDRTGWRDPDPDSGINTAGTVTGTIEEFAKGDTPSNAGPEFRAAKQAYADSIGYSQEEYRAENQAKPGAGVTDALNAKMASSEVNSSTGEPLNDQGSTARSTVESVGQRVKEFVGETIETLKTGVNNAGQTGVREKL
ncbi:hypothetical protein V8C86DRAFT_2667279 [Haematococcus lacustris]